MVAVLSMGGYSSCVRTGRFAHRVERTADSLFIVVRQDELLMPCDMAVNPTDVIRLARSELPVRFVPDHAEVLVPPPARWLQAEPASPGGG